MQIWVSEGQSHKIITRVWSFIMSKCSLIYQPSHYPEWSPAQHPPEPEFVRNAESPDLGNQDLHFNKILQQFLYALSFVKSSILPLVLYTKLYQPEKGGIIGLVLQMRNILIQKGEGDMPRAPNQLCLARPVERKSSVDFLNIFLLAH